MMLLRGGVASSCAAIVARGFSTTTRCASTVELQDRFFGHAGGGDTPLLSASSSGSLEASLFRYSTGVAGVRVSNAHGEVELLPFQGQAVWRASFNGHDLTMKSMFDEPRPVSQLKQWGYLDTYGAFALHCGALAMGCPGPEDDHQLHGELPNAPYQQAWLQTGSDEDGDYICMTGAYHHATAFTHSYVARPEVKVYADKSVMAINMNVTNLFHKSMDLMYMCHVNFRPTAGGRLVYSAPCTPDIRATIPDHVKPSPEYLQFLERLQQEPAIHNTLTPELLACLDPEVVMTFQFKGDSSGMGHSMQVLPDGSAHYISHDVEALPKGVRWMVVDGSQEALGLALPATADPEGKTVERAKGNVRSLEAGETATFKVNAGLLDANDAATMETNIQQLLT